MEAYEREYHDYSSNFDDRLETEDTFAEEEEEELTFKNEEVEFYRNLEEY
ncbi:hypothetical protein [Ekhidna sp.]